MSDTTLRRRTFLQGIIKEDDVMDAKTLPKVRMPHANDDMSPYKRRF